MTSKIIFAAALLSYLLFVARFSRQALQVLCASSHAIPYPVFLNRRPAVVYISTLLDLLFFRRIFSTNKLLWAASWIFHISFSFVTLRHMRFVFPSLSACLVFLQPVGVVAGYLLPLSLLYLIASRIAQKKDGYASSYNYFLLHLLEMLLAMSAGMGIFHLMVNQIPASSSLAAVADRETVLHNVVMDILMTVPMLAWMILRGHGWRHSLEMGVAMLAPIAVINLLCSLGVAEYLPWLEKASSPAMYLGMLAAMLYRRNHYTVKAGHSRHAAH